MLSGLKFPNLCLNPKTREKSLYTKTNTKKSVLAEANLFSRNKTQEKPPTQESFLSKAKNWAMGIGAVVAMNIGGSSDIAKTYTPTEVQPTQQGQINNFKQRSDGNFLNQESREAQQNNAEIDRLQNVTTKSLKELSGLKNGEQNNLISEENLAKLVGLIPFIVLMFKGKTSKDIIKTTSKESGLTAPGLTMDIIDNFLWLKEALLEFIKSPTPPNLAILAGITIDQITQFYIAEKIRRGMPAGEIPNVFGDLKNLMTANIDLKEISQTIAEFSRKVPGVVDNYIKTIIQNPDGLPPETLQELTQNLLNQIKQNIPKDKADQFDSVMLLAFILSLIVGAGHLTMLISIVQSGASAYRLFSSKDAPSASYTAQETFLSGNAALFSKGIFQIDGIVQILTTTAGLAMKKYSEAEESSIVGRLRAKVNDLFGRFSNQQNESVSSSNQAATINSTSNTLPQTPIFQIQNGNPQILRRRLESLKAATSAN